MSASSASPAASTAPDPARHPTRVAGSRVARALVARAMFLVVCAAGARAAAVEPKVEAAAKKLQTDAMDDDFLSLDYKKAKAKLQTALKSCAGNKCNSVLVAALHRDLGIVAINAGDVTGGAKELANAVAADPEITISRDYFDNPEVKKTWEAAKKKNAPATADVGIRSAEGSLGVKATVAPVGYELPIVIDVPKGLDIASAKVSFKSDAMDRYKSVEAAKQGSKLVAIVDCTVTSAPTTLKFFVKAYDADSSEVEHYGSIKKPAVIKVVATLAEGDEAPMLPGDKEPTACGDDKKAATEGAAAVDADRKPQGSGCRNDDECERGLSCVENDDGKKWCAVEGHRKGGGKHPRLWLGADGQLDLLFIKSEGDLCKSKEWACSVDNTPEGRKDVGSDPDLVLTGILIRPEPATGGKTEGGTSPGTARTYVSLDYFVLPSLSLGGRLGYAFGGNPTDKAKFVPWHVEARAQYFFSDGGFRPYASLGGGYAQIQGAVPDVIVRPNDPMKANGELGGQPAVRGVKAYRLAGPGFVAIGGGAWIMIGESAAVNLGLRLLVPVPTFTLGIAPELGFKIGF